MSKFRTEFKWAIVFTLCALIWKYFEKMMGWHGEHVGKYVIYSLAFGIVAIPVYVFALRDKKATDYNGKMTWKEGFFSGLILSVIVATLSPVVNYVTFTSFSPDFYDNLIPIIVDGGKMNLEEAQNYFNLTNTIRNGIFNDLSYGVVTGAIIAFFIKSKEN